MDEVFGERNFIAQIVVNLNPKGRQLGNFFATSHEYLLVYARDVARCRMDASSPHTVLESDFGQVSDDGRRFRHLPLRNTNKTLNPVTSDRKRVGEGKSVYVRVDLGGGRILKKK